ncbi:hypothetical protein KQX54_020974 [Cotesia glomerata]|uniref:Uncharacterized protein n=1 Tax=Cotesia glomerata TaxID=32391 RepID=A0AAV7I3Q8_COTGL|nr:hypothetical protein KQX54_020974 [Cotesia glomerata]
MLQLSEIPEESDQTAGTRLLKFWSSAYAGTEPATVTGVWTLESFKPFKLPKIIYICDKKKPGTRTILASWKAFLDAIPPLDLAPLRTALTMALITTFTT